MSTSADQTTSIADAQNLIAEGIRALAFKKYADACESLSRAVEALTEIYGELQPEVGDALMLYGTALLRNAIASSAVLGEAGQPKPVAGESSSNAVAGPSSGPAPPVTAANIQFHFGGDADSDEEEEEEEAPEDAGGDREDDLEMAFLMFDTARATWAKVDSTEAKTKLAEAHRLLGDVATESEQFENAVSEYTAAIDILVLIKEPHDRSLSELHMLIALAYDNVVDAVDRAVEHAEKAKAILLARIAHLESSANPTETDAREIADIKSLMGDVDMKIEDLKVVPEAAPLDPTEAALADLIKGATGTGKAQGIINNLNSLVKRKKTAPTTEESESNATGTKRKVDEVDEGSTVTSEEKKLKHDDEP